MMGHPIIFEKIMLMVGFNSPDQVLDNCRQVCKSWNAMIMNKIWENPTKQWGTIIQWRIKRSWDDQDQDYYPSDEKISQAKLLGKNRTKILLITYFCRNQGYNHPWCAWESGKESQKNDEQISRITCDHLRRKPGSPRTAWLCEEYGAVECWLDLSTIWAPGLTGLQC